MKAKKDTVILYAYIDRVNKNWLLRQSDVKNQTLSVITNDIITAARKADKP
jgi:hypothetical protein